MDELRRLSVHCNLLGLDRMLQYNLVCGMCGKGLQHALLAKYKLLFQIVLDISTVAEAASWNVNNLQGKEVSDLPEAVHRISISRHHLSPRVKPARGST